MRKRRTWVIAAVLVAMVAGAIVLSRLGDEGNVELGDRFAASSSTIVGRDVVVQIPYGRWLFTVADPVGEVLSDDLDFDVSAELDDADSIRGPEGSSIIRVEASPDLSSPFEPPSPPPPFAQEPVTTRPPPDAQAALVVDGAEFDLEFTYSGVQTETASVYVVVPGEADQLSLDTVQLRITVAEEIQTVAVTDGGEDDFGAAATLYEQRPAAGFDCPPTTPASTADAGFTPSRWRCEGSAGQYPYHPELGWAGEGQTWTWVSVYAPRSPIWESADGDEVYCADETATIGVQVSGQPPDVEADGLFSSEYALVVFRSADLPPALTLNLVFGCTIDPESTDLELATIIGATYDITIELPWE